MIDRQAAAVSLSFIHASLFLFCIALHCRLPVKLLRSLQQQLEQRDVQRDVQRLLPQVRLRAAGDRPGHPPPLLLLRHHGQSTQPTQAQVPVIFESFFMRAPCNATSPIHMLIHADSLFE
jgi:hypothetical protein